MDEAATPDKVNVADCAKLVSGLHATEAGEERLQVKAMNSCDVAVAILTAPIIELTVEEARRLPWFGRTDAFARLVVLRAGERLTEDSRRPQMDGEARIYGAPRYFVVPANSEATFQIVGIQETLKSYSPGDYCALVLTYGAPARDVPVAHEPFDMAVTVERHNADVGGQRVVLAPDARMLTSECRNFDLP